MTAIGKLASLFVYLGGKLTGGSQNQTKGKLFATARSILRGGEYTYCITSASALIAVILRITSHLKDYQMTPSYTSKITNSHRISTNYLNGKTMTQRITRI